MHNISKTKDFGKNEQEAMGIGKYRKSYKDRIPAIKLE